MDIQIYYPSVKFLPDAMFGFMLKPPTAEEFKTFIKVYDATYDIEDIQDGDISSILEGLYELFNSDKNPLGDQQDFVKEDLLATSMTTGCVILLNNVKYVVAGIGFKKLSY